MAVADRAQYPDALAYPVFAQHGQQDIDAAGRYLFARRHIRISLALGPRRPHLVGDIDMDVYLAVDHLGCARIQEKGIEASGGQGQDGSQQRPPFAGSLVDRRRQ